MADKSRAWVTGIEACSIDPVCFYAIACKLYGVQVANEVYGVDWRLYTGERIALYFAYYRKKRTIDTANLGIPYATVRNFFLEPEMIRNHYKDELDTLFPDLVKDKDKLFFYHMIGRNSICEVYKDIPIIMWNAGQNQLPNLDDDTTKDAITKDAKRFIDFHEKNKSYDDMNRTAVMPYCEMSFTRI